MNQSKKNSSGVGRCMVLLRPWLFPLGVVCIYCVGWGFAPDAIERSVHLCFSLLRQLAFPIGLALVTMVVFNRFLSPAVVSRFLGKSSGYKGILFSSLAGILSMGPVYAWYPLFTTLKEKGASVFHLANFIGCRSIKPVLLPVLIASFGWSFTLVFVVMSFLGALAVAGVVSLACSRDQ